LQKVSLDYYLKNKRLKIREDLKGDKGLEVGYQLYTDISRENYCLEFYVKVNENLLALIESHQT
jgi:hypothetical protein